VLGGRAAKRWVDEEGWLLDDLQLRSELRQRFPWLTQGGVAALAQRALDKQMREPDEWMKQLHSRWQREADEESARWAAEWEAQLNERGAALRREDEQWRIKRRGGGRMQRRAATTGARFRFRARRDAACVPTAVSRIGRG